MPRQNKRKASDGLKQTTLFDTPSSHRSASSKPIRSTKRHINPGPSFKEAGDTSDDDLAGITFAPVEKTPINVSSDDEDIPRRKTVPPSGKSKRVLSASSNESEPGPSSPNISLLKDSDNESLQSVAPRKRRRLRRRQSVDEQRPSENELSSSHMLVSGDSDNESSGSDPSQKRPRLRRKSGDERTSESELLDLADEVEEESRLTLFHTEQYSPSD